MNVSRLGLGSTLFAFVLTGCGMSLVTPYPGFHDGTSRPNYHAIVMAAAAGDRPVEFRDGGVFVSGNQVAGPLASIADREIIRDENGNIISGGEFSFAEMPLPRIRPELEIIDYVEVASVQPVVSALTEKPLSSASAVATLIPETRPARVSVIEQIDEIVAIDPIVPSAPVIEPKIEAVALVSEAPSLPEAVPALPLLATSSSTVTIEPTPAPQEPAGNGLLNTLDDLATVTPEPTPVPEAPAQDSILSWSDEEIEILLVQLEDEAAKGNDATGLERVRNMTPEEKARLRAQYEKRSFLGHFAKMDRSNNGALTREEMMAYFTIMHAAFDADYNNVVSRAEAPSLLLRIKLLGQGFPNEGLTLGELSRRLDETFTFLDKNNNDQLGWPELL